MKVKVRKPPLKRIRLLSCGFQTCVVFSHKDLPPDKLVPGGTVYSKDKSGWNGKGGQGTIFLSSC